MLALSSYAQKKLRLISFWGSIAVVMIHLSNKPYLPLIGLMTQWAVPYFLIVSGFFFARSLAQYRLSELMLTKCQTLMIPYVVFGVVLSWVLGAGTRGDGLGILSYYPSGNQPLWYVRSTFVFMLIFAMNWWCSSLLTRNHKVRYAITGIGFAICAVLAMRMPQIVYMPASPFYFLLGFLLSAYVPLCVNLIPSRHIALCIVVVSIGLAILLRVIFDAMQSGVYAPTPLDRVIRNVTDVLTVLAIWFGIDLIPHVKKGVMNALLCLAKFSFFIYLVHFPFVRILKSDVLPEFKNWDNLVVLLPSAVAISLMIVGLGVLLRTLSKRGFLLLTGGRG